MVAFEFEKESREQSHECKGIGGHKGVFGISCVRAVLKLLWIAVKLSSRFKTEAFRMLCKEVCHLLPQFALLS